MEGVYEDKGSPDRKGRSPWAQELGALAMAGLEGAHDHGGIHPAHLQSSQQHPLAGQS